MNLQDLAARFLARAYSANDADALTALTQAIAEAATGDVGQLRDLLNAERSLYVAELDQRIARHPAELVALNEARDKAVEVEGLDG